MSYDNYERGIQEELHEPDYGYDLPNYDGLVFQSNPPKIQMPNDEYETLELNANNDYTYPTERPGYDPASGMTVGQYNLMYDRQFPNGEPGMVIPDPGPLSSPEAIGRGINAPREYRQAAPMAREYPKAREEIRVTPAVAPSNGGEFMPHVGNSWYQADEPLLPWNRKDWDATRAGMADKAVKWYNK